MVWKWSWHPLCTWLHRAALGKAVQSSFLLLQLLGASGRGSRGNQSPGSQGESECYGQTTSLPWNRGVCYHGNTQAPQQLVWKATDLFRQQWLICLPALLPSLVCVCIYLQVEARATSAVVCQAMSTPPTPPHPPPAKLIGLEFAK